MNEHPYNVEHLREYTGILTSVFSNGTFKMELKVEDNPVLKERWTEKNASSVELNFHYNLGTSSSFFHNIFSCPKSSKNEECDKCKKVRGMYDQTELNLHHLQIGDTFRIMAALFKDSRSTLPPEVIDFKNYQPLMVAFDEHSLRLADTPEGINKKYEIEQQRLQSEREEKEKSKENEEQAQKDAETRKRNERIQQFFGKRPNLNQIIVTVIGTTIANQIPNIVKFVKYISRLSVSN